MFRGDRVTASDGKEYQFTHSRDPRPPQVVPMKDLWKTVVAITAALGISLAGILVWALDQRVNQLIQLHEINPRAHMELVRTADAQHASDKAKDAEIRRLTIQIDGLQQDVRSLRETIVELKTVINRELRAR